ncbi:LysR family transcriptional regulator [Nocardia stercoris]|uniref:LysR family transcriptional regulator n=1 Tax=Nocardia stercoris TaxID=2483361 RepID=A0A3M2L0G7_9NOCA|nr:LysR family transcriptional regulator [Nocardia stercoris]RMI31219.1 LysR family transcriptional regulator [Nocardia stercoris]
MELRQLRYFTAIARTGSFSTAAAGEFVVQSALSQQLRKLEDELGVRLFDRTTRSVRLTQAGAQLLPFAERVLSDVGLLAAEADALRGVVRGNIAVGMMECPPLTLDMAVLLRDFHAQHPGVEVALRSGGSDRMLDEVRTARLELAILGLPPKPLPAKLFAHHLLSEDLVGLVHRHDDLPARVAAAELADATFIDFPPGYGLREQVDHCFAGAGVSRRVAFEVVRVEEMVRFAALGLGLAILPRSIAQAAAGRDDGPRMLEITGADLRRSVALVHRHDGPAAPAARAFFDFVMALPQAAGSSSAPT